MKDKVLVRINVPIANAAYDLKIPCDLTVGTTADVITGIIRDAGGDSVPLSTAPVLWQAERGVPLDAQKTVRENGIEDGALLLLI